MKKYILMPIVIILLLSVTVSGIYFPPENSYSYVNSIESLGEQRSITRLIFSNNRKELKNKIDSYVFESKLRNDALNILASASWNLQDAPFGTICGIRVAPDFDHMADIANSSLSMFVGNLNQAYQIVDRRGVNVIRDNITNPDVVQWYFTKRTGGDLVNSEAVRFIEFKA